MATPSASTQPRHAAMAHFMFVTGGVSAMVVMHPDDLDLDKQGAIIPGAKGHDDRVGDDSARACCRAAGIEAQAATGMGARPKEPAGVRLCDRAAARSRAGVPTASARGFRTCRRTLPAATASVRRWWSGRAWTSKAVRLVSEAGQTLRCCRKPIPTQRTFRGQDFGRFSYRARTSRETYWP
jgi:hypothetical protein